MHLTTNDEEIHKMIGVTEVILTIHGRDSVMRYNNIRLDICKLLSFSARRSILAFFYQSIRRAAINFPKRCPFKTNTTYTLKQMSFDVNVFPFYVPEYNFTFIGHFFANDVLTMDVKVTGALCKKTNNCSGAVGELQP
ncbi:uncharacterized protein LOC115629165 [Scaptodrosophila lebanonensis]|uniref:Uncharacterized protein LOC115629165 n=1 Tax=Drosophila lebanonensis TaxID=7225 RepID=A0A6J2TY30_DROLE|nr:uncharacterized protein LOC115629165 [Scaptodrosophila lebanonensis]